MLKIHSKIELHYTLVFIFVFSWMCVYCGVQIIKSFVVQFFKNEKYHVAMINLISLSWFNLMFIINFLTLCEMIPTSKPSNHIISYCTSNMVWVCNFVDDDIWAEVCTRFSGGKKWTMLDELLLWLLLLLLHINRSILCSQYVSTSTEPKQVKSV